MKSDPPPIDWAAVHLESRLGRLAPLLGTLPRARWTERDPKDGETFLHFAARGDNAAAVVALVQCGVDVNARGAVSKTAAHIAATHGFPRVLEVLCAAGADIQARSESGISALDFALGYRNGKCVRVLIANGARLRTVIDQYRELVADELVAFERGVLCCHAVVVVLLGLKRRRGDVMRTLDRWVVRELALASWATRSGAMWQLTRWSVARVSGGGASSRRCSLQ